LNLRLTYEVHFICLWRLCVKNPTALQISQQSGFWCLLFHHFGESLYGPLRRAVKITGFSGMRVVYIERGNCPGTF